MVACVCCALICNKMMSCLVALFFLTALYCEESLHYMLQEDTIVQI